MAASVPLILFAHGAGASSASPWMRGWKARLSNAGEVETFDYPYMAAGRRLPDRLPVLLEAHRSALQRLRGDRQRPLFLAGKSLGSRVGCHLALEQRVAGLVCFGFPLLSLRGQRRDAVLLELETPILFLTGTKDRLCPLDELEPVRARMKAHSELCVVEGGDHSLLVGVTELRRQGRTQEDVDAALLRAIVDFTQQLSR